MDSLYVTKHLIFKILKPVPRSFCLVPIIVSLVHFTTWRISKFSLGLYTLILSCCCCCSLMSDSLQLHGLQHARLPCPSQSLRVCSNSCLSSWWCHPTISSSVIPFSSCPQSFPASGTFPRSQLFASGGQSIGASASASVLPMKYSGLISFRTDWFLLAAQRALKSLLQQMFWGISNCILKVKLIIFLSNLILLWHSFY